MAIEETSYGYTREPAGDEAGLGGATLRSTGIIVEVKQDTNAPTAAVAPSGRTALSSNRRLFRRGLLGADRYQRLALHHRPFQSVKTSMCTKKGWLAWA